MEPPKEKKYNNDVMFYMKCTNVQTNIQIMFQK